MPSETHPSQRAIDLSRANPLWGSNDHSFVRGPVHPYTTRDYYAPENRYSIEGPALYGYTTHPGFPAAAGVPAYSRAHATAMGNGYYGHPVGPQGLYNVASGNPGAYPHFAGYPGAHALLGGAYAPCITKGPYSQ